mmetsp:Transcript_30067/g.101368  ORF Transcript_30067/g.101368 Transcript_30067/m.101368 type:complete len:240 (-) Transcript_30067:47-766(-)
MARLLRCLLGFSAFAVDGSLPPPSNAVALNTSAGLDLLFGSGDLGRYVQVASHHATQQTQALCGVASAVIVLNALPRLEQAPVDAAFAPFPYWTQDAFLADECVTGVHDPNYGSTLGNLAEMLRKCVDGLVVEAFHADGWNATAETFRDILAGALGREAYVVANFFRGGLGEDGGYGHFSPIVAFNRQHDMALVLDVARYKYGPLWVPLAELAAAMDTFDSSSGKQRGCLVLSTNPARS